jgi:serine/threonine protein kinase
MILILLGAYNSFLEKFTFWQGKLVDGSVVAIKQLSETSRQGKKEFVAEIETISRVQHRNLVKLFGFCLEGNKPLLVYEYMESGSLDKALFGINHFIQFIQRRLV